MYIICMMTQMDVFPSPKVDITMLMCLKHLMDVSFDPLIVLP